MKLYIRTSYTQDKIDELKKYFDAKSSFSISELDEKYFINMNRKIKIDILSKIQLDIDER